MTDSTLTTEQVLSLLRKLATDDAFRNLFEAKPAKALHEAGVPAETIVNLGPLCVSPHKLADKSVFQDAVSKVDDASLQAYSVMKVPQMSLRS